MLLFMYMSVASAVVEKDRAALLTYRAYWGVEVNAPSPWLPMRRRVSRERIQFLISINLLSRLYTGFPMASLDSQCPLFCVAH